MKEGVEGGSKDSRIDDEELYREKGEKKKGRKEWKVEGRHLYRKDRKKEGK